MTNEQILELCEWIASDAEEMPEKQTNADKLLLQIYRTIHSHKESCCYHAHKEWREEAEQIYKDNEKYF